VLVFSRCVGLLGVVSRRDGSVFFVRFVLGVLLFASARGFFCFLVGWGFLGVRGGIGYIVAWEGACRASSFFAFLVNWCFVWSVGFGLLRVLQVCCAPGSKGWRACLFCAGSGLWCCPCWVGYIFGGP